MIVNDGSWFVIYAYNNLYIAFDVNLHAASDEIRSNNPYNEEGYD
jgi:hypothetical protein